MARRYDLEERTEAFAKRVRDFVSKIPKNLTNVEYGRQLLKASSSVGANYIEANEALSKRDFALRIKICRKESKESRYWLRLIVPKQEQEEERDALIRESSELLLIFNAILRKAGD